MKKGKKVQELMNEVGRYHHGGDSRWGSHSQIFTVHPNMKVIFTEGFHPGMVGETYTDIDCHLVNIGPNDQEIIELEYHQAKGFVNYLIQDGEQRHPQAPSLREEYQGWLDQFHPEAMEERAFDETQAALARVR